MPDRFDAIVVGARVAGAPLATHLARAGLRVCLVDRAELPSDTLSTHLFQNLPALERLGVLERLLGTGAPLLRDVAVTLDGARVSGSFPDLPMLCVRRPVLDQVLLDNAVDAGVEARTRTRISALVEEDERVAGVRVKDAEGIVTTLRAPVVVGADGRNSTVARLVGARRYNVTDNERGAAWAYYEDVDAPADANFCRTGEDLYGWCPVDGGAFIAMAVPTLASLRTYRDGDGTGFDRAIARCDPLASLVARSWRRSQGWWRSTGNAGAWPSGRSSSRARPSPPPTTTCSSGPRRRRSSRHTPRDQSRGINQSSRPMPLAHDVS